MSDSEWRSRIRWVVVHPHRLEVLLLGEAGAAALPAAELAGEVWTADAEVTATALRELVGFDAILLRSLVEHLQGPVDLHMAASTAWWLRKVLAGLRPAT